MHLVEIEPMFPVKLIQLHRVQFYNSAMCMDCDSF